VRQPSGAFGRRDNRWDSGRRLTALPHAAAVGVIFSGQSFRRAQSQNCETKNWILKMNNKLKVILVGGPNDGQTWELDEAKSEIEIAFRMQEHPLKPTMKVTGVVKYKLKSNGPPPQYEFVDSN
jgi:hypothetical protein